MKITRRRLLGCAIAAGVLASAIPRARSIGATGYSAEGVDFRTLGWMPPVRNQSGPQCTVVATTQATSWLMSRAYGWTHAVSFPWSFIYKQADLAVAGSGRMARLLAYANQTGIVCAEHPTARIRLGYMRIQAYPEAFRAAEMKRVLDLRVPVVMGLWLPQSWSGGQPVGAGTGGAHEVFCVGYNANGLLFQNSYGSAWQGDGGYGLLPWAYAAENVFEAWAITSVKPSPN